MVVATATYGYSHDGLGVPQQMTEVTIRPGTLRVNHAIPDSLFTLEALAREGTLAEEPLDSGLPATMGGDTGEVLRAESASERDQRSGTREYESDGEDQWSLTLVSTLVEGKEAFRPEMASPGDSTLRRVSETELILETPTRTMHFDPIEP